MSSELYKDTVALLIGVIGWLASCLAILGFFMINPYLGCFSILLYLGIMMQCEYENMKIRRDL